MTHPKRRKRIITTLSILALVVGLAACDVTLDGDHANVSIKRTCRGEQGHTGTTPYYTQTGVTIDGDETEDFDILISYNSGAAVYGGTGYGPNDALYTTGNTTLNVTKIEVAVVPSDGVGDGDEFTQIFNACPT